MPRKGVNDCVVARKARVVSASRLAAFHIGVVAKVFDCLVVAVEDCASVDVVLVDEQFERGRLAHGHAQHEAEESESHVSNLKLATERWQVPRWLKKKISEEPGF